MLGYANIFISTFVLSLADALSLIIIPSKNRVIFVENFYENLRKLVWDCLPIVTFTIAASSLVFVIHMAPEAEVRGLTAYIGGLVTLSLVRETVPVMGALAIITQYSTGMTAQIGSMKVTEQIDALKLSGVNPTSYLLMPMIFAGVIGVPILSLVALLFSTIVSFLGTYILVDTTAVVYLNSIKYAVVLKDFLLMLLKAIIFGFFIASVSYTNGIITRGGAKAVGTSTRMSVVINFALIIILDYIITALWL